MEQENEISNQSEAGKGDRNRSNSQAFRDGYDLIDFGNKDEEVPEASEAPPPCPHFTIHKVAVLLSGFHDRLLDCVKQIPIDEDGDVASMDGEIVHTELMLLLRDVEEELEIIRPYWHTPQ